MTSDQSRSILLVDDDEIDRRRIKRFLGSSTDIHEATNGAEAESLLESNEFDLVIMDYSIPSTNTLQLIETVVAKNLPVVMLTGEGNEEIAVEAMKHGAKDYLVKDSVSGEVLLKVIDSVMQRQGLEREVIERRKELEDFAYVASHDLSAPLARIRMCTDMLAEVLGDSLTDQASGLLRIIESSSKELMDLIGDLLEYSRTGRSNKPLEPISLNVVLAKAKTFLEARIMEAQAEVDVQQPMPTVMGDRVALCQLFQNLIGNGIKFVKDNQPHVKVIWEDQDPYVQITVKDNGVGIAPEHQAKVFNAFQRLHSREEFEGSGLGLAICRKVIDQHKGRIWIESEVGQGTAFIFTLMKAAG